MKLKEKIKSNRYFFTLFLLPILFISLLIGMNYNAKLTEKELINNGDTTIAKIIRTYHSKGLNIVYEFYFNSKKYDGNRSVKNFPFEVGEKYYILYLQDNPEKNQLLKDSSGNYIKFETEEEIKFRQIQDSIRKSEYIKELKKH